MIRAALAASFVAFAAAAQGGAQPQQPGNAQQQPANTQPANALTLEQAVKLALERNYDLRRSEYQSRLVAR